MAPLEAGKLFRFPNLWGDKRQHYGHVSWLASYAVPPGVSPGIMRVYETKAPARVFLPRRRTTIPPGRATSPTVAESSASFTLLA